MMCSVLTERNQPPRGLTANYDILSHARTRTAYFQHCVCSGITGRKLHRCTRAWPSERTL